MVFFDHVFDLVNRLVPDAMDGEQLVSFRLEDIAHATEFLKECDSGLLADAGKRFQHCLLLVVEPLWLVASFRSSPAANPVSFDAAFTCSVIAIFV